MQVIFKHVWMLRGLIKYSVTYETLKTQCLFVNDELPNDRLWKYSHYHVRVFQIVHCHTEELGIVALGRVVSF